MPGFPQQRFSVALVAASLLAFPGAAMAPAQQIEAASVIQQVDASVKARTDGMAGYTVSEHYAVYRSKDETHPVAEMTVNTTYRKDTGKSYAIVSQSGSGIIRSMVLETILDNEKRASQPGIREGAWITSANYEMTLKPGGTQPLAGRDCLVLALTPKRKSPYLVVGTLWVDSKNGSIVQVQGTASRSSSVFTGPTQVTRQYDNIGGFPQATHVRALSNSFMFGQTIVTIDYQGYQIQLSSPE
jgi:outer membrane lipoprotein-sorting protein